MGLVPHLRRDALQGKIRDAPRLTVLRAYVGVRQGKLGLVIFFHFGGTHAQFDSLELLQHFNTSGRALER